MNGGKKSLWVLTHIGLTPEIECYDLCKNGWQSFLYSLNKYLTTGIGAPFKLIDTEQRLLSAF